MRVSRTFFGRAQGLKKGDYCDHVFSDWSHDASPVRINIYRSFGGDAEFYASPLDHQHDAHTQKGALFRSLHSLGAIYSFLRSTELRNA